ncbi:MAG: GH92 family glycosyl hydrolase [Gemmatimonadota bacterium]|nr:MAG: GH92 family glycosyl hydrolase [Gemmatimonadota bacterium]
MIGYHSVPVILDAWSKGLTRIDPREALEAMKASATQDAHGLRYYHLPEPTSLDRAREAMSASELPRLATIDRRHLNTHGRLANGFARSISGASFPYHSPFPDCRSGLLVRTDDGNSIVEWETGSAPEGASNETVSFTWLAGIDANDDARAFELLVNDTRWLEFRGPSEQSRSFRVRGPNGSSLSFRATHTDRHNDLFGFMFLTLPPGTVTDGERLRLGVRGEAAGTPEWYMTFEHAIEPALRAENVYGLVSIEDETRQLIRIDVEHMDSPADADIRVGNGEPLRTRLEFGHNSVLAPAPLVSSETPAQVTLNVIRGPTYETKVLLRPVRPYDYIPADWEPESVSKTLEYAFDDWCIARMALSVDEPEDTDYFYRRARYYRSLFDPTTGFMRARLADGSWKVPFTPTAASHRQDEYTEGNAWQYSWFVPHDVRGLQQLMGGSEAFIAKLDELFEVPSEMEGEAPPDISGMIGQYAHGNEPSHHIAYLYAYAGAPWKAQERIRQITDGLYDSTPEGLPGNEDCGQMSAWYIFSALGFYPVNPADGIYVIGTPHFERATIDLGGGRAFSVEAPGVSSTAKYIQSASLNGRSLDRCYIAHEEIMAGGTLVFRMGDSPNQSWAASEVAAPPSMTR